MNLTMWAEDLYGRLRVSGLFGFTLALVGAVLTIVIQSWLWGIPVIIGAAASYYVYRRAWRIACAADKHFYARLKREAEARQYRR